MAFWVRNHEHIFSHQQTTSMQKQITKIAYGKYKYFAHNNRWHSSQQCCILNYPFSISLLLNADLKIHQGRGCCHGFPIQATKSCYLFYIHPIFEHFQSPVTVLSWCKFCKSHMMVWMRMACTFVRFVRVQIKENIKAPRRWPLWWEFTGHRWISRTKGQ